MSRSDSITTTTSETVTNDIRVAVTSRYMPEKSNPMQRYYFFSYDVTIINEGSRPVQLISRYWKVRDAFGRIEEIRGPGVIGKQPRIQPGESFQYSSFCPLNTEFGSMQGNYQMISEDGGQFDAEISSFQLISPQAVN
jgi:ApaG protein